MIRLFQLVSRHVSCAPRRDRLQCGPARGWLVLTRQMLTRLALASCALMPSGTEAAEPAVRETPAALQQQIVAIYQQGDQSTTIAQWRQALAASHAIPPAQLAPAHQQYLSQLQSWLHTQIGVQLVEQASDAHESGASGQAEQLEATALSEFHQAVRLAPQSWKARHQRGVSLAQVGQLQEAIADFNVAITENPDFVNAWFNRAEIHYQLGQFAQAEADYSAVIQRQPSDVGALTGRAHARFELRKYQPALEDYDAALQQEPENARLLVDRADLQAVLQQWQAAANDYRAAIRLDPQNVRAYQNVAWMMATCPDERFRNAEMAVKAAQRALALAGDAATYHAWDSSAAALAAAGRFEEAAEAAQQAIALAPPAAQDQLQARLAGYRNSRPATDRGDSDSPGTGIQPAAFTAPDSANAAGPWGPRQGRHPAAQLSRPAAHPTPALPTRAGSASRSAGK